VAHGYGEDFVREGVRFRAGDSGGAWGTVSPGGRGKGQ
jgi:hypothetical protein